VKDKLLLSASVFFRLARH